MSDKKELNTGMSYEDFKKAFGDCENVVDAYVELEDDTKSKIEAIKEKKREGEQAVKTYEGFIQTVRSHFTNYLAEIGKKKIEGKKHKSVSYQEAKTTTKTVTKKQIKLGRNGTVYTDLSDLSKDDLALALEELGVKTRLKSEEVEVFKDASIIVVR